MRRWISLLIVVSVVMCAVFVLQHQNRTEAQNADSDKAGTTQKKGEPAQAKKPEIDDDIKAVIRKLADFYKAAKSIEVETEFTVEVNVGGESKKETAKKTLAFERPNRFLSRIDGKLGRFEYYSDGKQLVTYLVPNKAYIEEKAPESLEEIVIGGYPLSGSNALLNFELLLLTSDPYENLMMNIASAELLGVESVGKIKAHHLKCQRRGFDWEIWVAAKGDPLLLKLSLQLTEDIGGNEKLTSVFSQSFRNWKINKPIKPETFAFIAPEDARKTDDLFAPPPSPLLGTHAPNITLDIFNGKTFNLKKHKGKDVVVLDFWTTSCRFCLEAFPHMIKVAEDYKEKGVVFYTVNVGEEPELVREFLEATGLNIIVPLDTMRELSAGFGVKGFPTTVIIGKKGIIQAFSTGFHPSEIDKLRKQLDTLLKGKNLVKIKEVKDGKKTAVAGSGKEKK